MFLTTSLFTTSLLLAFLPLNAAQLNLLLPDSLPACAQSCIPLDNAVTGCTTGGVPPSTYQSCFCQSALIPKLRVSPIENICTTCSDADFTTIYNWYQNLCQIPGATPIPTTPVATTTGGGASNTAPATSSSGSNGSDGVTLTGKAWLDAHWGWIAMLIVLAVAFTAIGIGASIWRKKHRRRREAAENLGPRPDLEAWGPNQHSVHNLGVSESYGPNAEKGKGKETTGLTRGLGSKKLKKALGIGVAK